MIGVVTRANVFEKTRNVLGKFGSRAVEIVVVGIVERIARKVSVDVGAVRVSAHMFWQLRVVLGFVFWRRGGCVINTGHSEILKIKIRRHLILIKII